MTLQVLIDKQDNFEIVRDQIAAILVTEVANQKALATAASKDPALWDLAVYVERSNPWERWLNQGDEDEPVDEVPIVNVWFDGDSFPGNAGTVMERQKAEGVFNIDIYGFGSASDNGAGHKAGDKEAALNCQRAVRLVRNILMASENTYLQLRGLVGRRWVQSRNVFQPEFNGQALNKVVGARLSLQVHYNEFAPQYEGDVLELLTVRVKRTDDNQVILAADYDYTL